MVEDAVISREKSFFQQVGETPYLEKGEDRELGRRWQRYGDVAARNRLVESHLRFAIKLVRKNMTLSMSEDDLTQEASLGLMRAAEKYDPDEKDFAFATYAHHWVMAFINEQKMQSNGVVKYGTTSQQKAVFFGVPKHMNKVQQHFQEFDFHKFPDAAWQMLTDLINADGRKVPVSVDEVRENTKRAYGFDASLDMPIMQGEATTTFVETLVDDSEQASDLVEQADEEEWRRNMLVDAFASLNDREKDIVIKRRLAEEPATLETLSEVYDVSKERIRQIEMKGMEKLRKAFRNLAEYRFGRGHPAVKQLEKVFKADPKFTFKM